MDLVLLGAEGVVENGGVINKLGTYQIALAAAAHNTPFYVAAESYKARWGSCGRHAGPLYTERRMMSPCPSCVWNGA